jgi:hypothetical protein
MGAAGEVSTGKLVEAASTRWWKMELDGKIEARKALFPAIEKVMEAVTTWFAESAT